MKNNDDEPDSKESDLGKALANSDLNPEPINAPVSESKKPEIIYYNLGGKFIPNTSSSIKSRILHRKFKRYLQKEVSFYNRLSQKKYIYSLP